MPADTETTLPTLPPRQFTVKERVISNLVQAPIFFSATAAFGTVSLLASLTEKDGRRQHRIARAWARCSLAIAGSPIHVTGLDVLHHHPVAVYASNHLSYMDTPAIFAALPFQFRILARSDLWKLPFIGWHLKRSGQIPVAVDNPRASIASLTNGVRALKAGMPLFVFPEGGRSRNGQLGPFMSGPAYMAIRAGVPIIPMALVGTYELLPIHTRHFSPRPLELRIGAPIATTGLNARQSEALTAQLRQAIEELRIAPPSSY
ncbi:MAG: 1-acyl-sn-glycerol-3-phosphate acyltransferase [Acidobacteriaceae bacterium]|jgi:1-acyl-sn-glycerol-3-phosphate acyltransferase|nr:1-acyl-sn-glycerol-3-phosphate acyltransferase [Acidobacteriaceae bacterium]